MASLSIIMCRIWDIYVMNAALSGWILSKINTYNSSLLCVWVIFLCDMVYILDALARTSKTSLTSGSWASVTSNGLPRTILANLSAVVKVVTFVPYHILVILELDACGVYLVVCALRVARLLLSGRLYLSFAWTLSNVAEYRAVMTQRRSKRLPARKTCGKTRKENADEFSVERTVDSSPFLRHIKKLIDTEMERNF